QPVGPRAGGPGRTLHEGARRPVEAPRAARRRGGSPVRRRLVEVAVAPPQLLGGAHSLGNRPPRRGAAGGLPARRRQPYRRHGTVLLFPLVRERRAGVGRVARPGRDAAPGTLPGAGGTGLSAGGAVRGGCRRRPYGDGVGVAPPASEARGARAP